jgi:competence protein ComEA
MDEAAVGGTAWWRSPRLVAAAACFLLGTAVLAAGLVPRLAPPAATVGAADPLAGLDGLDETAGPAGRDDVAAELVVYVSGAVVAPDVYRLPAGARVKDAVVAAGGLRADAAGEGVNLAEPLSDAQHVHIPALGAPVEVPGQAGDAPIDLNRASATDLEELPGVGKVLAERIVARRDEHGPFASVDELRDVTGVGAKLFEQIAPLVRAGP